MGRITEDVGVLVDGSVLPRIKGPYHDVGHHTVRLNSLDRCICHGHRKEIPSGQWFSIRSSSNMSYQTVHRCIEHLI